VRADHDVSLGQWVRLEDQAELIEGAFEGNNNLQDVRERSGTGDYAEFLWWLQDLLSGERGIRVTGKCIPEGAGVHSERGGVTGQLGLMESSICGAIDHAGADMKIDEGFHGGALANGLVGVHIVDHGLASAFAGQREAVDASAKGAKAREVGGLVGDLAEWGFVILSLWEESLNTAKG
jgi:hypothetical protein